MSTEAKLYERLGVAASVTPQSLSSGTTAATSIPTDSVDMRVADKALAIVSVGSEADYTVTAKVEYGSASYNTAGSATAFAWSAVNTAATNTGGTNSIIGIEVDGIALPSTHPYLRIIATASPTGADTLSISGTVVTYGNRYKTVPTELDSVTEVES